MDDESDSGAASASPQVGGSPHSLLSLSGRLGSRGRRRQRRRRSSAPVAELPELEKTEEDFKRDWGISREREVCCQQGCTWMILNDYQCHSICKGLRIAAA